DCTRKQIEERGVDSYDGFCRERNLTYSAGDTQIRLLADKVTNDFVLWRKEDNASYQLASVVDDSSADISLIVRGEELWESTQLQLLLASMLGTQGLPFQDIKFFHHKLLSGGKDIKLSKSNHDLSLKALRESGRTPSSIFSELGQKLKIDGECSKLEDF